SSLLVVDDDDGIRTVLEREGFRVTVAGDGECALDLLRHTPVDCILLDVRPGGAAGPGQGGAAPAPPRARRPGAPHGRPGRRPDGAGGVAGRPPHQPDPAGSRA